MACGKAPFSPPPLLPGLTIVNLRYFNFNFIDFIVVLIEFSKALKIDEKKLFYTNFGIRLSLSSYLMVKVAENYYFYTFFYRILILLLIRLDKYFLQNNQSPKLIDNIKLV